jgi:hypothetical protein
VCGTAAEVSRSTRSTTVPIPCPGPMTTAIAEEYAQGRPRPDRPLQGLGRTWRDRRRTRSDPRLEGATRPGLPEAVEIFDTTLRDGAQLEGISLTVDDKLRIAEQLD